MLFGGTSMMLAIAGDILGTSMMLALAGVKVVKE